MAETAQHRKVRNIVMTALGAQAALLGIGLALHFNDVHKAAKTSIENEVSNTNNVIATGLAFAPEE